MNKALFFRKCSSADDYFKLVNNYPDLGTILDFEIIHTITLPLSKYLFFINNFLMDNEKISRIKDKLFMDENDKVYCAFVTCDKNTGFLVYPSGYNYARYVAFYKKQ